MILKTTKVGGGTLRVNANHHAEGRKSHAGADAGIFGGQRRAGFRPGPPNRDLRSGRAHSAETALPRIDQKRQRCRAPLSGQAERTQPAADHSSDSTVSPKRRRAGEPTPPAAFPDPLHGRRHRLAGSGRRRPRRALGPGGASHPVAGIHRLQQGRLPTVSLDLGLPHLQLAADRGLSSTPRPSHQDPQPWG